MPDSPDNLRSVNELGKIYASLTDRKSLCDFFPDSVSMCIEAAEGHFFLVGEEDRLWLESSVTGSPEPDETWRASAQIHFESGKPILKGHEVWVPLVVRSSALGVAGFRRAPDQPAFTEKDRDAAFDLASQMAAALKNILLFEQNIEMEKLAAIGKSMGMVMHEIKNIIQLAGFAEEWMARGISKNNTQYLERGLEGIRKALKEMNGFVHELLSLTKNYEIQPVKVNLKNLFNELAQDLEEKARAYSTRLEFEVDPALPEVDMEERSIYRTLLNLIKNAMEACDKEDACVRVTARPVDNGHYCIEVRDNGQGMPEEVRARLFQAFFSTKGEKGTGLGLMVVQKTVKAHRGRVEVESKAGEGTAFQLILPQIIS